MEEPICKIKNLGLHYQGGGESGFERALPFFP